MGLLDNLNKVADKAAKVASDKISDTTRRVDKAVSGADSEISYKECWETHQHKAQKLPQLTGHTCLLKMSKLFHLIN